MTTAVKNDAVEIVRVCASVWSAIQKRHPDVPDVAITMGSGVKGKQLNWGHFHAGAWTDGTTARHELFIGGEGLQRGPVELLGTLLHEAAHGVAVTRGVKDNSRQGRFHNTVFKAIGMELGLELSHDSVNGWSSTKVPETTQKRYAREIKRLEGVLGIYRRLILAGEKKRKDNNYIALECMCGRKARVSKSTAAQGPIICGVCDTEFERPEPEEDESGNADVEEDGDEESEDEPIEVLLTTQKISPKMRIVLEALDVHEEIIHRGTSAGAVIASGGSRHVLYDAVKKGYAGRYPKPRSIGGMEDDDVPMYYRTDAGTAALEGEK